MLSFICKQGSNLRVFPPGEGSLSHDKIITPENSVIGVSFDVHFGCWQGSSFWLCVLIYFRTVGGGCCRLVYAPPYAIGSTRFIPCQAVNFVHNRWSHILNFFSVPRANANNLNGAVKRRANHQCQISFDSCLRCVRGLFQV